MLFAVLAPPLAYGQRLVYRVDGRDAGAIFGAAAVVVGDLDGDGVPDLTIGAPLAIGSDQFFNGRAFAYSGASGDRLFQLDPLTPRGQFGMSLGALGDIDGDGIPDLLIGAPFTTRETAYGVGSVLVFSGGTGQLLFNFIGEEGGTYMGWSLAGTGDVDGDGVPDFAIGTPYGSGHGQRGTGNVMVRSGATGEVLYKIDGLESGDFLGWSMASIPDLDGDGVSDLVIGAPSSSPQGLALAGSVQLRSGKTGKLIRQVESAEPSAFFGRAVAAIGDVDGDGVADFIVGAPEASPHGVVQAGSAFVFSGASGKLIFRVDGATRLAGFGSAVAGGLDVDGDGVPDFAVGVPDESPGGRVGAGSVFVYSGSSGDLLFKVDGESPGDNFGRAVLFVDLDGDGRAEVVIGSPYASPSGLDAAGSVFVLSY